MCRHLGVLILDDSVNGHSGITESRQEEHQ